MIWFLTLWSLSSLGFISLACSMSKHQKQLFGHELSPQKTTLAQYLGWIILGLSLMASIWHSNFSIGISYWLGAISFSALFVAWCLSYFETHFKMISLALTGILLLMLILQLF